MYMTRPTVRGRARSALLLAVLGLLATSCAAGNPDPSAPYFPKSRPVAPTPAPVDPALSVPPAPLVVAGGSVSRPDPQITPGVVAVHDVNAVCQLPKHPAHAPLWDPVIIGQYHIPANQAGKYALDYLIPLQLGGAQVRANTWPVALRGIGFHEKQRLNARLRIRVCQGAIPLDQAQHDIATDWYTLYEQYGA
jgi:hypothetical protein